MPKDITKGLYPIGAKVCFTAHTPKSKEQPFESRITYFGTVSGYSKTQIRIDEVEFTRESIRKDESGSEDRLEPVWGSYPTTLFGRAVHHARFSPKEQTWFVGSVKWGARLELYTGEPGVDIRIL